ncbi:hypothetical protein D9M69_575790 [compost metagenome]
MPVEDAAQARGRLPLAVVGIIAQENDVPDAAIAHLIQRHGKRLGALVEDTGRLARFRPAANHHPLAVDGHPRKIEIAFKIMKMRVGDNGDAGLAALQHQSCPDALPAIMSTHWDARRAAS